MSRSTVLGARGGRFQNTAFGRYISPGRPSKCHISPPVVSLRTQYADTDQRRAAQVVRRRSSPTRRIRPPTGSAVRVRVRFQPLPRNDIYDPPTTMFKYTMLIAALAVSASLAVSVAAPQSNAGTAQEPTAESTNLLVSHKKHAKPEKIVFVAESKESHAAAAGSGLMESGMLGLLNLVSVPRKLLGAAVGFIVGKLKNMDVKKLLKTALLGALVTVLGAVAAVAVAGLVSLVSAICAVLPYIRFFFGGKGASEVSESHIDTISDFVLGAFNKYDTEHKA